MFELPHKTFLNDIIIDRNDVKKIIFKLKKYPKVTDYFNTKFYFSNACLNCAEHICYYPQQKIKRTDALFLVLFSL